MTPNEFQNYIDKYKATIEDIKLSAHKLHEQVNQTYDRIHPYGLHLDMVVESVYKYGCEVCEKEEDILPLFFGAYFHDSIEDARLTYGHVVKRAGNFMDSQQANLAAEIVYALTNDKGRTRAERAGERYYQGIRKTPYAPFVKLADRLANTTYSYTHTNEANRHMKTVYKDELPHCLDSIHVETDDLRFSLPQPMITALQEVVSSE